MIFKEIKAFLWVPKSNMGLCLLSLMDKLALGISVYVLTEAFSTNRMVSGAFFLQESGLELFSSTLQQPATILNFSHLEKLP